MTAAVSWESWCSVEEPFNATLRVKVGVTVEGGVGDSGGVVAGRARGDGTIVVCRAEVDSKGRHIFGGVGFRTPVAAGQVEEAGCSDEVVADSDDVGVPDGCVASDGEGGSVG